MTIMKTLLIAGILLVLLAIVTKALREKTKRASAEYFKKKPLSVAEQVLYYKLVKCLPNMRVLAQVSLSALVGIKKGDGWQSAFNKTSRKYVDFVICSPAFEIVAVIELDDSTHLQGKRIKADADKETALEGAGIKIIRWWINEVPSGDDIAALFSAKNSHPVTPSALP